MHAPNKCIPHSFGVQGVTFFTKIAITPLIIDWFSIWNHHWKAGSLHTPCEHPGAFIMQNTVPLFQFHIMLMLTFDLHFHDLWPRFSQYFQVVSCYTSSEKAKYLVLITSVYDYLSQQGATHLLAAIEHAQLDEWIWHGDGFTSVHKVCMTTFILITPWYFIVIFYNYLG